MEDDILSGVDTKGPAGIDATDLMRHKALNLLGQLTELRRI